jgi:hypothetical protein
VELGLDDVPMLLLVQDLVLLKASLLRVNPLLSPNAHAWEVDGVLEAILSVLKANPRKVKGR